MRAIATLVASLTLTSLSAIPTYAAAAQLAATPPNYVAIAPCRILDTATAAPQQASGTVDISATRCSGAIPPYATRYAVRITRTPRNGAELLNPGVGRTEQDSELAAAADHRLTFDLPANAQLAVDVYGYYVPPAMPVAPGTSAGAVAALASDATTASSTEAARPGRVTSQSLTDGTAGDVILNASVANHPTTGVLMRATTGYPHIVARLGTTDAGSGFHVFRSNDTALLRVRGDGVLQLVNGTFLDGQSDFFGTPAPGNKNGVSIAKNIVHDVTLVNPHDSEGGTASRVIFFNAATVDENGSPAVTKFRAYTGNYYNQGNINYDSQVYYHWGTAYHFRAYSTPENKETFWVRAATSFDSVNQTRADVFVSGHLALGSPTISQWALLNTIEGPATSIGFGASTDLHVTSNAYNDSVGWKYKTANPVANYYLYNGVHTWRVAPSGAAGSLVNWTNAMVLNGSGNVGIGTTSPTSRLHVVGNSTFTGDATFSGTVTGGNIQAKYQDVAEWVPATEKMSAGTVVVLNRGARNEVTPSSKAYDTAVAGVVSDQPGLILGEGSDAKAKIATTGRVKVHVDAGTRGVEVGDLLVTSNRAGTAMVSQPVDVGGIKLHRPGTLIGKALEPLPSGEGDILVLLSLQ